MFVRGKRQVVQVALWGLLLCGAFVGTAESKKKVAKPAPAPVAEDMAVEGIAGQLDAPACERVLEQAKPDLKKCYDEVASRMYFLSGHIELKLFIGTDGKAKRIITQKSNVGSYEVERCLVQTLQKIEYPAAKGGLGEITYPMDFAGRGPLGAWGREQIAENLDKEKKKLLSCQSKAKKGGSEKRASIEETRLTMYVAPGGQVAAVGFSSPKDPLDEGVVACLDTKVRQLKLADPLGKIVKIEYSLGGSNDSE